MATFTFDLNALRETLAGKIEAEGLTVALDPRDVNPPCVLIGVPRVVGVLTGCAVAVELSVEIVAPPPGNLDALEWMLEQVPTVMGATGAEGGSGASRRIADTELPVYQLNILTTAT